MERKKEGLHRYDSVIKKLACILSKWNVLINIIYKHAICGWKKEFKLEAYLILNEFVDNLYVIREELSDIFFENIKLIKKERKCKIIEKKDREKYISVPVDVSRFYNNNGFSFEKENSNCDLTGCGEYFKFNYGSFVKNNCNVICNINNTVFEMRIDQLYNNIICYGQSVFVCHKEANKGERGIALLCCSEWGMCKEMICLKFKSGEKYEEFIEVNDISDDMGKSSFVVGQTFESSSGKIIQEKASVTIKYIFYNDELEEICLPRNRNLHILAINMLYTKQ